MKHNTFDFRDVLRSEVMGGAGATAIRTPRAAQAQTLAPTSVSGEVYAHLTSDQAAFVEALVDHMLRFDEATRHSRAAPALHIDSTFVGNWGAPGAALYRVGMAATNLYCKRAFGELFEQISDSKQTGVLHLLDTIRFVFQDGSDAGVFFAIAYASRETTTRVPGSRDLSHRAASFRLVSDVSN